MKLIRPETSFTYNIHDTKGLKLLTKFPLGLSRLGDHRFRHNFHCVRKTLFHKIDQISGNISLQSVSTNTKILLFGDNILVFETNKNFTDI